MYFFYVLIKDCSFYVLGKIMYNFSFSNILYGCTHHPHCLHIAQEWTFWFYMLVIFFFSCYCDVGCRYLYAVTMWASKMMWPKGSSTSSFMHTIIVVQRIWTGLIAIIKLVLRLTNPYPSIHPSIDRSWFYLEPCCFWFVGYKYLKILSLGVRFELMFWVVIAIM